MQEQIPEMSCERCGFPLPPDARFCPNCGAPVTFSLASERKIVTVVFADLVGSTKLAAQLDPERFREVVSAFFRMASTELTSLRGRAEKFIGDAVMAVFGVPHAHEDDAVRAVRAALMIRERTARLGEELSLPVPLEVRIGVNSGAVATGSGLEDQLLVSGAAVNLAARLQEAAEPNEILAGPLTRQLTIHAVAFGEPRTIQARGFDQGLVAYPVESLSSRSSRRTIPLVGRQRELAMANDAFARVEESARPHLLTLSGESGIGKSRLVEELVSGLDEDVTYLSGRASEFVEDVVFAPIAQMIRKELAVERDTPLEKVAQRLREVVEASCDPSESELVAARLGLAVGLEGEWDAVARLRQGADAAVPASKEGRGDRRDDEREDGPDGGDGREGREGRRFRAAEVKSGFLSFVEAKARFGPLVLIFEDLHLAEPELLDLVAGVVRDARRSRLLVVAVARDTLFESRPDWGGGLPDVVAMRLEPLTDPESVDLAMAAGESLDEETARRVAAQAGGNPFFIIETTGMLLQRHPEHVAGAPHSHLLPPTVQSVVAARIDHLPDDAKEVFRRASVFFRGVFDERELTLVAQVKPEMMERLEDEELLVRDPDRPGVWRFRHGMLRDVAYESLPKRERQRLHLAVADGLEREEPGRWPQAVAYHLEQAARAGLDLNPLDRPLADRATKALARAGDQARWRLESRTAIDLYERALALSGPDREWGVRQARILAGIGEARYWLGEFDAAIASLTRALQIGGEDAWTRTRASRFLGDIALNYQGDPDRATELFDQALAAARELDDPWATAPTLLIAGWAPYWRGDLEGARKMFGEALDIARNNPEKDPWNEARALTSLMSVTSPVGDEEEALALGRQALDIGRQIKDPFTVAVAQEQIGNSLRRMWNLDEAMEALDESIRIFRDLDARWELASALGDRATVRRLQQQLEAAETDLRDARDLCLKLGERSLVAWTSSRLAFVLLARGQREEALRILEEPISQVRAGGLESRTSSLWADEMVALHDGDIQTAKERARETLRVEEEQNWPNPRATQVWWMASVYGADSIGGEPEAERARSTLEKAHWIQSLKEPELILALLGARTG